LTLEKCGGRFDFIWF